MNIIDKMNILVGLIVCDTRENCIAYDACHDYCRTRESKRQFINEIIAEIKELREKANEQEK